MTIGMRDAAVNDACVRAGPLRTGSAGPVTPAGRATGKGARPAPTVLAPSDTSKEHHVPARQAPPLRPGRRSLRPRSTGRAYGVRQRPAVRQRHGQRPRHACRSGTPYAVRGGGAAMNPADISGRRWLLRLVASFAFAQGAVSMARPAVSYHALELGADAGAVGVVSAAFALLPLAVAVPLGRRTDRGRCGPLLPGVSPSSRRAAPCPARPPHCPRSRCGARCSA